MTTRPNTSQIITTWVRPIPAKYDETADLRQRHEHTGHEDQVIRPFQLDLRGLVSHAREDAGDEEYVISVRNGALITVMIMTLGDDLRALLRARPRR